MPQRDRVPRLFAFGAGLALAGLAPADCPIPTFATTASDLDDFQIARCIATADVDGDGDIDVGLGTWSLGARVDLFLNDGAGGFVPGGSISSNGLEVYWLVFSDLDLDGDQDAAFFVFGNSIRVFLNDGAGQFTFHDSFPAMSNFRFVLADFDGDGDPDYAAGSASCVRIHVNDGTGQFDPGGCVDIDCQVADVAAGDLDQDGDSDLVTACRNPDSLVVLLNSGRGEFVLGDSVPLIGDPDELLLGDVDQDCTLDVVFTAPNGGGDVGLAFGNADGSFGDVTLIPGGAGYTPALGDADGDGDLDILTKRPIAPLNMPAMLMLNEGEGVFAAPLALAGTTALGDMAAADLTGDGTLDLANCDLANPLFHISLNICAPRAVVGDLDGDGIVNGADLGAMLAAWGRCAECDQVACPADLDGDCVVGSADLGTLLSVWSCDG